MSEDFTLQIQLSDSVVQFSCDAEYLFNSFAVISYL